MVPIRRKQIKSLAVVAAVLFAVAISMRSLGFAAQSAAVEAPGRELPDMTPQEIAVKLAEALKKYERGYLEVEFQDERNVNPFSENADAQPLMKRWPGQFRYASDGQRWRGEYEGTSYSPNSQELEPRGWSAGFDGEAHFSWEKPGDTFIIGEQVAHEGIPLPGFFWSSHGESFPKSLQENEWKVSREEIVDGYRCYSLVWDKTVNEKGSRQELVVSPQQDWLPVRYKVLYDGKVSWTHELSDLAQTADGRWYPQRVKKYEAYASRTYDSRVVRYEPEVKLDDSYFSMEIPVGVGVCDYRSGHMYRNDPWWTEIGPFVRAQFDWPPVAITPLRDLASDTDPDIEGEMAPPLEVGEWIQGGPIELEKLRGKVVLLYFSAGSMWSPDPQWTAALKGLYDTLKPFGLEVVEINIHTEDTSLAKQRVNELRIPWPVAVDGPSKTSVNGRTFAAYRLKTYITPLLIDHQGRVRLIQREKIAETTAKLLRASGAEKVPPVSLDFVEEPPGMTGQVQSLWRELIKHAPKNARITGRVSDASGGLAKVEIVGELRFELNSSPDGTAGTHLIKSAEEFRGTTDNSGRFELAGLTKGVYQLTFRLPGRARVEERVVVPANMNVVNVDVEMNQPDGIEGRVVSKSGEPVAGAYVHIRHRHHSVERERPSSTYDAAPAITDKEGSFALGNLQSGAYTLDVSHNGVVAATLERVPAGTRDAVATLPAEN